MKTTKVNLVGVQEWDKLVKDTYGREYSLQQQEGCMDRCTLYLTVPDANDDEELDMRDSVPEVVNGNEMGVKFSVWLERDPKKLSGSIKSKFDNLLFWERNFYPLLQTVANDLHARGLLEAGEYAIDIDW